MYHLSEKTTRIKEGLINLAQDHGSRNHFMPMLAVLCFATNSAEILEYRLGGVDVKCCLRCGVCGGDGGMTG